MWTTFAKAQIKIILWNFDASGCILVPVEDNKIPFLNII